MIHNVVDIVMIAAVDVPIEFEDFAMESVNVMNSETQHRHRNHSVYGLSP